MTIHCIWEHNGPDTLLYAAEYAGAYTRGASLEEAMAKMPQEIRAYCRWLDVDAPDDVNCVIVQEAECGLMVRDADSDVLFDAECAPLTFEEYARLKAAALRSASDFQRLYEAVPNHHRSVLAPRKTFFGMVPRTAQEMYDHTRSVNSYYFGEIGADADNEGTLLNCRERGFALLEQQSDFLANRIFDGSYEEQWTLRKVLRRFIWHDRIHAKAMLRMAKRTFPDICLPDPFFFEETNEPA